MIGLNAASSGSVAAAVLQYFQLQFPDNGLTIILNISLGSVICYASDQVQNPNARQTYIWLVQTDSYTDLFIDPLLLGRAAGDNIFIGIEGVNSANNFTVNNTAGDKRGEHISCLTITSSYSWYFTSIAVPTPLDAAVVVTTSVGAGEREFFRFPFPMDGLTIQLTADTGRVVCYVSDRIRNPTNTQGYDWRIETDNYSDVYIDPQLLTHDAGQYIYAAVEGIETSNNFTLNSTEGDRRGMIFFKYVQSTYTLSHTHSSIPSLSWSTCHRNSSV